MTSSIPKAIVASQRSGEIVVRDAENARADADAAMHCSFTLGTYEIVNPAIVCPRSMPPPTTELCQPICIESVV